MEYKEKSFVSAIVYIHNAENRISDFLDVIIQVLEDNFENSEIICVNDYSADNSLSIIKEKSRKVHNTSVSLVNMSYFHGIELSMNAGIDISIGDFVFEFDNTHLDFNPDVIMQVYWRAMEGYDIVSASPDIKEKLSSRLFYRAFDRFANISYKMSTESFRILSRRMINRIGHMNKTVPYRKVAYAFSGLKTDRICYTCIHKHSNISFDHQERKMRRELAVNTMILFTDIGYRFSLSMSFIMLALTVFVIVYTIIAYIVSTPVEGWTSTILFLSISFFGVFGVMTMVIKYLQLILELIFKRQRYCFESIEKLTE